MGLSGTATRAIWISAVIGASGALLAVSFQGLALSHGVVLSTDSPGRARALTLLDEGRLCYDGGTLTVEISARNAANAVLDLGAATALLDGRPLFVSAQVVGVGATSVWGPGDTARWTTSSPGAPFSAMVVTASGTKLAIKPASCA